MFLFDRQNLYGRYWGALEEIPFLHFEACLYQGIDFCIEQGLAEFDPGTQGEHKLMRGFEPVKSSSWHWIADLRFRNAIEDFLRLEKTGNNQYQERAAEFLPYRKNG
jgi:predicted N-acyltransferase